MLEVREDNMKGNEVAFINCHFHYINLSFSPESISGLIHDLKEKKYKRKEEKLHYITLKKRNPSLLLSPQSLASGALFIGK